MGALKLTACMKVVAKMGEMDQDALLERLDRYSADGVPKERAQIMAASDTLAELEAERKEFMSLLRTQHPDLFVVSNVDSSVTDDPDMKFSLRRKPDPENTVQAYKLFRVDERKPGTLFPLFVNANDPVPLGKWLDAEEGPVTDTGKVKSKLGPLAYRPGWHAGDLPIATHIGEKSRPSKNKPDVRPDNQVWAEVEFAADRDWQTEANKRGTNSKGKLVPVKAHITDQIPEDGFYRYKTNPNMTGNWLIGGSMKVLRVMSDDEVASINLRAGVSDLPRQKPFDADKYGFDIKRSTQRTPYTIETSSNGETATAKVGSRVVGKAHAWEDSRGKFVIMNTEVRDQYRRRGIASAMYKAIEDATGRELTPAVSLSDDAFELWKSYRPEAVSKDLRHWKDQLIGARVDFRGDTGRIVKASGGTATMEFDQPKDSGATQRTILRDDLNTALSAAGSPTIDFSQADIKRSTGRSNVVTIDLSEDMAKRKVAKEWVAKVRDMFPVNPMNPRQRVMMLDDENMAVFELDDSVTLPGAAEVVWFQAYPLRNGNGTKAMQELQRLAAEDDIPLTLYPWDKGRVSQASLIKFYKKNGFEMVRRGGKDMIWKPEGEIKRSTRRHVTETPEFKNWFGDSKVVAQDGQPIVVYTGTSKDVDFKSFKIPKNGAWFTDSPETASEYAKQNDSQNMKYDHFTGRFSHVNTSSRVIPAYLRIEKPYVITEADRARMNVDNYKRAQGQLFDELRAKGHDGVDMGKGVWVVIGKPTQIKSAIGNIGAFDPNDANITRSTQRSPLGFYSALAKGIEDMPTKQAPAGAWKSQIKGLVNKGAVKADEVEWSGINDWLDLQQGKVSKEQVAQYLEQGGVRVEETVLGKGSKVNEFSNVRDARRFLMEFHDQTRSEFNEDYAGMDDQEIIDSANELFGGAYPESAEPTKYGQYTLPGGENYREVLLTLPGVDAETQRLLDEERYLVLSPEDQAKVDAAKKRAGVQYRSRHWDQPNVLAHIRVNDRTDADGNKVLFVEELQSDWGQEGKKRGFRKILTDAQRKRVDELNSITEERDLTDAEQAEYDSMRDGFSDDSGVPVAPFVTKTEGWLNLALKRVMVMAAEGGYDKVAFATGQQNADRPGYDLSKRVDSITYEPTSKGYYINVMAGRQNIKNGDFTTAELEGIVGKEIVQKMEAREGKQEFDPEVEPDLAGTRSLSGLDLKVGGEGMKTFYDTIVPTALKKLLPKVGGGNIDRITLVNQRNDFDYDELENATPEELEQLNAGGVELTQPGFDVTDAMREKVEEGLTLFSKQRAFHGTPYRDIVEFSTDKIGTGEGAQAYGWGLYFASKREVADWYRKAISLGRGAFKLVDRSTGKDVPKDAPGYAEVEDRVKSYGADLRDSDITRFKEIWSDSIKNYEKRSAEFKELRPKYEGDDKTLSFIDEAVVDYAKKADDLKAAIALIDKVERQPTGQLYEVDIPEDNELLLWDKPLSEQPPKVREALKNFALINGYGNDFKGDDPTGGEAYQAWGTRRNFGSPKAASQALAAAGIKGIKYLDGTSRYTGYGTYNYVIFSGDDVEVAETYYSKQRDQTETPEFRVWAEGLPVQESFSGRTSDRGVFPLYHATTSDFSEFKPGGLNANDSGPAIWLSPTGFTGSATFRVGYEGAYRDGANVMPVYAKLKSPLVLDDMDMLDWARKVYADGEFPQLISNKTVAALKADGYDSVILDSGSIWGKPEQSEILVFDPTQIKSALGNDGSFDPSSPDIRRSTGRTSTGAAWDSPSVEKFDDLVYKLQDKQIDTKRVVDAIKTASGAIADDLNVYLQEELYHGRTAKRTEDFVNMELNPLVEQLAKDGLKLEDLEEYLHARHAEEANKVIAARNPGVAGLQDGGSGMMTADAKQYLATLPADLQRKLSAAAAKVDAILGKTRQLYVDYELESKDTVDAWGKMFQHYIPLQREDKDGGPGIGQGFSVKGRETKGRTGSTRKVVDILANIALQRERAIVRGEKNRVSQALVGLAEANPNDGFWKVDIVPTERVFNEKTGLVEDRVDPLYKSRENALIAKIADANGRVREHAVLFNEEDQRAMRMAAALKNLDAAKLEGLMGVSASISRYFAAVNTQYNPVFGVVNLVRDVQGAILNLGTTPIADDRSKVAKYTLSALRGIYGDARAARKGQSPSSQWAALWDEFQEVGGQTGYRELFRTSADRAEAIKKVLDPDAWADSRLGKIFTVNGTLKVPMAAARRVAGWIFDWLSDYNLAMENGVRLAAYKAALERGLSKEQAASVAKNLTVNFNRKGQIGQQAGALYAFFNASVQGTARIGQTLFDMEPGKPKTLRLSSFGKKVVGGGMMLGSIQALMLAAAGYNDEDPPEFVRERSLIIPLPGGKYMTIPMPLGFHVIPNIGRHATEFALSGFKDPHKRAVTMAAMFADTFNPIGNAGLSMQTLAPTALDPLVALTENRDYTGKPIARESSNKAMPGHALSRDTATSLAKFLSEGINTLSGGNKYVAGVFSPTPDQIDYLIGQVTGGVGRELSKVEQTGLSLARGEALPTYKVPLAGRFFGDTKQQASEGSQFYANTERLNRLETEIKGLQKDGKMAEAAELRRSSSETYLITQANVAERQIQRLRNQKRELVKEGAPREQVRAIEEQITQVMARLNRAVESLREKQEN